MAKRSAGIVLYRQGNGSIEVFLVHPGGPFWAKKDAGAWSIPKGLYEDGEDAVAAARREFEEETGFSPSGNLVELGEFKQPGGKIISAFAVQGDADPLRLRSNLFSLEWPPKSGKTLQFPEVDRAAWFETREAVLKLVRGQIPIVEKLLERIGLTVSQLDTGGPQASR